MEGKKQKYHIPFDLVIEILSRLPVESLLKFQYVSKTWGSIIRSKDFISSLVHVSSTSSSRLLISFKNGQLIAKNAEKCLYFFTSSQEKDHESSSLVSTLNMRMTSMDAYFNIRCAPVNGFVCLSYQGRFMICNPSTRQVITLPELTGNDWNANFKYLGYDPVDDKYKAMCKRFSKSQEHMVLTLGGDEKPSWRRIEGTPEDYCPVTKGICINGFVYYGAITPTKYMRKVVVCFDVRSERLSLIEVPYADSKLDWERTSHLINYQGKLALVKVLSTAYIDYTLYGCGLCVLQDPKEHQWTTIRFSFRSPVGKVPMSIQGTNQMGEIIITPKFLPLGLQPINIIYYDVESDKVKSGSA